MSDDNQNTNVIPRLFKGLEPFMEDDFPIFFGRDEDRERLVYNLQSSRLTILYGSRQVGKTSLLRAGVTHYLRQIANKKAVTKVPELAVVVFEDWKENDVLARLSTAIEMEVQRIAPGTEETSEAAGQCFLDRCKAWTKRLGKEEGELFILLDQFENYLLFHPSPSQEDGSFDVEFTRVVTTRGLAVNFLISIRDDLLASLDRYRFGITNLYDSLVRLEPLNEQQAYDSIRKPFFNTYNPNQPQEKIIGIESELVSSVLESVRIERYMGYSSGQEADNQESSDRRYNSAGLQHAMKAIWEHEFKAGSNKLRESTFAQELGGILGITDQYLETCLRKFNPRERNLGARVFDNLVTSGGVGVAYPLPDLAEKVGVQEEELKYLVEKLEREGILTNFAQSGSLALGRYEVSQRILTYSILKKVSEYRKESAEMEQKLSREIEDAHWMFSEKSQLDGLNTIIDAGEALLAGYKNLLISNNLEVKVKDALQQTLDKLTQRAQFKGYKGAVSSVAFSRDGSRLITGTQEGSLILWQLTPGEPKPLPPYEGYHKSWIWAIRVSQDGDLIAAGSDDGTVSLWSLASDGLVFLYHARLPSPDGYVRSVSFNPTGELLAIATTGGSIYLWHLLDRQWVHIFSVTVDKMAVRCVEFDLDGKRLATGSDDGVIRCWDLKGNPLDDFKDVHDNEFKHDAAIWSIRFSPDGSYLASGGEDHTIKIWNLKHRREESILTGHTCWVLSLRFNSDGTLLASASEDGTARLWDIKGNELARFTHGAPVNNICFSPDDHCVATASADCRVGIWATGQRAGHQRQFRHPKKAVLLDVSFSPDGQYLTTGSTDNEAQLWDVKDGNLSQTFTGHKGWIMCVTFHPASGYLATGSADGTARVWEVSGKLRHEFGSCPDGVLSVAFGLGGKFLLTGSGDGKIRVWDMEGCRKQPLSIFPDDGEMKNHGPIWSIRFSPLSNLIASGSNDGVIQLWDQEGKERMQLTGGHQGPVLSLAFSPDECFLASSSSEGKICLWKVATGERRDFPSEDVQAHDAPVWSVAFSPVSPDGETLLASASLDRSASLWDMAGNIQLKFFAQGPIRGLSFSPDGKWLAGACSDGSVRLWPTKRESFQKLLKDAKSYLKDPCGMSGKLS